MIRETKETEGNKGKEGAEGNALSFLRLSWNMGTESGQKHLSEEQIDEIVIAQADDDTAWEEPVWVQRPTPTALK